MFQMRLPGSSKHATKESWGTEQAISHFFRKKSSSRESHESYDCPYL